MRISEFVLLISLYALLPLIPSFLYLNGVADNLTFFIVTSRVAGIYAFVWYALQFMVTARSRVLDKIGAQDRRLVLHMQIAIVVLAAVFVHTTFGDEKQANEIQVWFGSVSNTLFLWVTLLSGLFFTNYFVRFLPLLISTRDKVANLLRLNYEHCQLLHLAIPVGMLLLLVHVLLLPGEGLVLFKLCMALLGFSALTVYLNYKIRIPKILRESPWSVAEVVHESDSVITVYLNPPAKGKIKHRAGQFCFFRPLDNSLPPQSHPFTISSKPDSDLLSVTVKHAGDFTTKIRSIKPGCPVCIDGAYGKFSYKLIPTSRNLVFIAGGIGITPMLSMLRDLATKETNRKVILFWGAKCADDLFCFKEIQDLEQQMKNFEFVPVLSDESAWTAKKGRIDNALLTDTLDRHGMPLDGPERDTCEFFICGPAPLVSSAVKILKEATVPGHRIHTERFAF